jgi:hypothetical protein
MARRGFLQTHSTGRRIQAIARGNTILDQVLKLIPRSQNEALDIDEVGLRATATSVEELVQEGHFVQPVDPVE